MSEPVTLAALGTVALAEGVKFLYGQAGEILKRWREHKATESARSEPAPEEPLEVHLPSAAFQGQLRDPRLNFTAVAQLERELRELRAKLADYAEEIDEVDPNDERLIGAVDGLRRAMEAVYGQPILFKGEQRPTSDVVVVGEAKVKEVLGYVAGLRAKEILTGSVTGRVDADKVGAGAEAVGLDVGIVGAQSQAAARDVEPGPS
jgi:hypothetical protein